MSGPTASMKQRTSQTFDASEGSNCISTDVCYMGAADEHIQCDGIFEDTVRKALVLNYS